MKTYSPKSSEITRAWHLIDAKDQVLGRLATQVASLLMGKSKTMFARHLDMADHVVITNAERVKVTSFPGPRLPPGSDNYPRRLRHASQKQTTRSPFKTSPRLPRPRPPV